MCGNECPPTTVFRNVANLNPLLFAYRSDNAQKVIAPRASSSASMALAFASMTPTIFLNASCWPEFENHGTLGKVFSHSETMAAAAAATSPWLFGSKRILVGISNSPNY